MNTDCLTSAPECLPSRVSSSRFSVLKKDSAQALSRQFPFSSHALADRRAALPEFCAERAGAVLDAAVGMKQQSPASRNRCQPLTHPTPNQSPANQEPDAALHTPAPIMDPPTRFGGAQVPGQRRERGVEWTAERFWNSPLKKPFRVSGVPQGLRKRTLQVKRGPATPHPAPDFATDPCAPPETRLGSIMGGGEKRASRFHQAT
jgi:hypothetical protein